eukprot:scaffold75561_cov55-Attheya_sp.AAC.7
MNNGNQKTPARLELISVQGKEGPEGHKCQTSILYCESKHDEKKLRGLPAVYQQVELCKYRTT